MAFSDTTSELARQAQVTQPTIRKYADAGLLSFIVASDGTRLFEPGQAPLVRRIYERNMANRRRQPAA